MLIAGNYDEALALKAKENKQDEHESGMFIIKTTYKTPTYFQLVVMVTDEVKQSTPIAQDNSDSEEGVDLYFSLF